MPALKPVQLAERELESLLESNPDAVEEGLVILARQLETDTGPLDLLAVDGSNVAVVIELKVEPEDGHLAQGLRYYDWVTTNIGWISKVYPKVNPKGTPRLLLIAPEFTDTVRRIAKYVNFGDELSAPELIEYTALMLLDGSRGLFCRSLEVGEVPFSRHQTDNHSPPSSLTCAPAAGRSRSPGSATGRSQIAAER